MLGGAQMSGIIKYWWRGVCVCGGGVMDRRDRDGKRRVGGEVFL